MKSLKNIQKKLIFSLFAGQEQLVDYTNRGKSENKTFGAEIGFRQCLPEDYGLEMDGKRNEMGQGFST